MEKKTTKKVFVISLAAATSLGYLGGLTTAGYTAQGAIPMDREELIVQRLGAAATGTVEGFIQSRACPKLDTQYELTGVSACAIPRDVMGKCISVCWTPGEGWPDDASDYETELRSRLNAGGGGSWTPGKIQEPKLP